MSGLVLASASSARQAMLRNAGLEFDVSVADIDERAIMSAVDPEGEMPPTDVAEILAQLKATTVSGNNPGQLIIGADQTLEFNGKTMVKAPDMEMARKNLLNLRGQRHLLHSAVCCAIDGDTIWSHVDTATLTMRDFTPEFVGSYLAKEADSVLETVGAYRLEGLGAQLFERIEGDFFTILGLPLIPLLEFLRSRSILQV